MTVAKIKHAASGRVRFPDIPERSPHDMTSARAIHLNGRSHSLRVHFSRRPNTVVDAERYISPVPTRDLTGLVYPDLLIAFDADSEALDRSNAYVISEQGKAPDFILEVASRSTRARDRIVKRDTYAELGVLEYWRFDEKPTLLNPGLAGDRLVEGEYQPIAIEVLPGGRRRGYSAVLDLVLEWSDRQLWWFDPKRDEYLRNLVEEQVVREVAEEAWQQAEARADTAEIRADTAEARAREEEQARLQAEARIRELEAQLERRNGP